MEIVFAALFGQLSAGLIWALAAPSKNPLADSWSLFAFLMIEAVLTLGVIAWLLRQDGQDWRSIGWRRRGAAGGILTGIASLPVLFATAYLVIRTVSSLFPQMASGANPLLDLIGNWVDAALFLATSILVGGFKEEIQRAFILERFRSGLGGVKAGLVLWSLFFGALHAAQGLERAAAAAFLGLIFGILYLRRRHLAAPICAHALYDATVVLLTWWGS